MKSFGHLRLMKAQTLGDTSSLEFMRGRRILEVNPDHPIIKDLNVSTSYSIQCHCQNNVFRLDVCLQKYS